MPIDAQPSPRCTGEPMDDRATDANPASTGTGTEDAASDEGAPDHSQPDATHAVQHDPFRQAGQSELPLTAVLESLLFVADEPIAPAQIASIIDRPVDQIEAGLAQLDQLYRTTQRGLRVQKRNDKFALVTVPAAAPLIEAFLQLELNSKLSGAALEALSIIAYRQPATRAQVEAVRGVDCGGVLRTLLQHELIAEVGRLDAAGRPILYAVTDRFMHHFGLTDLDELPPLSEPDADTLWAATELTAEADAAAPTAPNTESTNGSSGDT